MLIKDVMKLYQEEEGEVGGGGKVAGDRVKSSSFIVANQ